MNISIREAEGGYYIKLGGRGRLNKEWITKDKEEVVRIVRSEFLLELTADQIRSLEQAMKKQEEDKRKKKKTL